MILGTTSACAENTIFRWPRLSGHGNYLRVRGEYTGLTVGETYESELPPRARRIQHCINLAGVISGTTSACAENTNFF